MKHLGENVCRRWPDLWAYNSWILHPDIAQSQHFQRFFAKSSRNTIGQVPYFQDVVPSTTAIKIKFAELTAIPEVAYKSSWMIGSHVGASLLLPMEPTLNNTKEQFLTQCLLSSIFCLFNMYIVIVILKLRWVNFLSIMRL